MFNGVSKTEEQYSIRSVSFGRESVMGLEKKTLFNDPFQQFSCSHNFRCCTKGLVQLEADPVIAADDCIDCSDGQSCVHEQDHSGSRTCSCPIRACVYSEWVKRAAVAS